MKASKDQGGHGDQIDSDMTDIEQLLHLLRVSVRVTQNEKTQNAIIVSLRELAQRTRYSQNVECMLDSGSFFEIDKIYVITQNLRLGAIIISST